MKLQTKITEMLGIEYPILLGAMETLSDYRLVAAVSNAGGLGVLTTIGLNDGESVRREILKVKALTHKPFAVNITLVPELTTVDYDAIIDACIDEGVKIIETSAYAPEKYMAKMKGAGIISIHKCTTVKHALKAQKVGCDAVIIDGCQAAGRIGETDVGSVILWPAAVDALSIPVIACGGIGDGRGIASALMMGCEAVTLGTRFFLSHECPACMELKEYLANNINEADTILLYRSHRSTVRLVNRGLAARLLEMEKKGASYAEMRALMSFEAKKKAFHEADLEEGTVSVGQGIGLIHSVLPVKDIIENLVRECHEAFEQAYGRFAQ